MCATASACARGCVRRVTLPPSPPPPHPASAQRASDHKPVYALMEASVKRIITERRAKVHAELVRSLDQQENQAMPRIVLDRTEVRFSGVVYKAPASQSVTITNTGASNATFYFKALKDAECVRVRARRGAHRAHRACRRRYCKPWLSCEPKFGIVLPGTTQTLTLTVVVDVATAREIRCARVRAARVRHTGL